MLGERKRRGAVESRGDRGVPNTRERRLLQAIEKLVSWESIRERARPFFSTKGRPSIDPVVMVKMMLIGYLFGVPSDRELVEQCADRECFLEFLGYSSRGALPVHSNFTHWRKRLGSGFFREMLHDVVRTCANAGMEFTGSRTVDGTMVKAQADRQGPLVEIPQGRDLGEYLAEYEAGKEAALDSKGSYPVNTHDPGARLQKKRGCVAAFRYNASFCAETETGIITDATATPLETAGTAVDHVEQDPFGVTELAADALYDEAATLWALQERGIATHVPDRDRNPTKLFEAREFEYDEERDEFICPAGNRLKYYRYRWDKRLHYYIALASDCKVCPLKSKCTTATRRTVTRVLHSVALRRCVRRGLRYRRVARRRRIHEHLNRMGKRDHCLTRARGLGLEAMKIQAALTAIVINLKKLVRFKNRRRRMGEVRLVPGLRMAECAKGALQSLYCRATALTKRLHDHPAANRTPQARSAPSAALALPTSGCATT